MKKTMLFAIAAFLLFFTACKKEKNESIIKSRTELITSGSWNLTAARTDNDGDGIYEDDEYALFDACFKDNYYSFFTNGKIELNEGATKCDPMDPQTEQDDWHFDSNETHLVIGSSGFSTDYIIEVLDNTTLRVREEYGNGRNSVITFTKM